MQHTQIRYWDGLQAVQGLQNLSGTPPTATLQGLQPNTAYRVQAALMENQTELAVSETVGFRTLVAGTISLQLHNCTRIGYDYVVHYIYTSTYALSNAILSTNGGQVFQGTIANGTITFTVSGLTAGEAYLYSVQAEDIYQETATATGTITTTVLNQLEILYSSRTEDSVTFDLSYLHDYTFRGGWIDVWNSTDDPSTDNPISSEAWFDGDTQVTVPNLTAETTYKFRAGMTVEDAFGNQTEVYSSVLTQTTSQHDYSKDYFTITNESSTSATIYLKSTATQYTTTVYVSTDDGITWSRRTSANTEYGTVLGSLGAGGRMLIRHSGGFCNVSSTAMAQLNYFRVTGGRISVSGNITSLTNNAPSNNVTMPAAAFRYLFKDCGSLLSADNLYLGGYVKVTKYGFNEMFSNCTGLHAAPNMEKITEVDEGGMRYMFDGCTYLQTAPDIRKIVRCGVQSFEYMFNGCTALNEAYAPTIDFRNAPTNAFNEWMRAVSNSGTLHADSSIASTIPTNDNDGCPSGWSVVTN